VVVVIWFFFFSFVVFFSLGPRGRSRGASKLNFPRPGARRLAPSAQKTTIRTF
jgi:hypothetical protein